MRDANLNDDMLKLVRFKILFVKRDYEVAFPEEEDLVSDNISGADFSAWKVAEFIQKLNRRPPEVRWPKRWENKTDYYRYSLPEKWKEGRPEPYKVEGAPPAKGKPDKPYEAGEAPKYEPPEYVPYWLIAFPEDDKKHLRVYYEVLDRYPRERLRYEERQLEILEKIADRVKK